MPSTCTQPRRGCVCVTCTRMPVCMGKMNACVYMSPAHAYACVYESLVHACMPVCMCHLHTHACLCVCVTCASMHACVYDLLNFPIFTNSFPSCSHFSAGDAAEQVSTSFLQPYSPNTCMCPTAISLIKAGSLNHLSLEHSHIL